jgi:hypothetical protein
MMGVEGVLSKRRLTVTELNTSSISASTKA